jgi:predicted nucleotidyltransferase
MLYIVKETSVFDNNVEGIIYREESDGTHDTLVDELVGFVIKDKGVELYKPMTSQMHDMYINTRTLERIAHIYEDGNDVRVNNLWDFILEEQNEFSDYDTTYYYLQYSDDDLLK